MPLHDRRNGDMRSRAPRGEQQIYLVIRDQLLVNLRGFCRFRLVVVADEFDFALAAAADAETARGVELIAPEIVGLLLHWSRDRKESRACDRVAYSNCVGSLNGCWVGQKGSRH